jgi:hypothetical protein
MKLITLIDVNTPMISEILCEIDPSSRSAEFAWSSIAVENIGAAELKYERGGWT